MTVSWERRRPPEVANLLNPAFLALLLQATAHGYTERSTAPLPYTLPFVALPLCVDPYSRERLPRSSATSMLVWLAENPDVRYLMPALARDFRTLVREALIFGAQHALLIVGADGAIAAQKPPGTSRRSGTFSRDMLDMYAKASIVGKWFGRAGNEASILSAWGVTP